MSPGRKVLLWGSQNEWMKKNIPKLFFVRKALRRFMPGENIDAALIEAQKFNSLGIGTIFTKLGENISTLSEAEEAANHYLSALSYINGHNVQVEISLKLTLIGIDILVGAAKRNFERIIKLAKEKYKMRVLISYGMAWYPWYMRRLAERPANLWIVLRNVFTK